MRIKSVWLTLLLLAPVSLLPRTVVFPFKINSSENKAHQWLGRGISLYLSYGLRINGVDTYSDNEGKGILKSLKIKFPYNVSKASVIRAARLMKAERLVWGEITTSPGTEEEMLTIRTFIVDLRTLKQKYLPMIRGKITGLFSVQKDLLGHLVLYAAGREEEPETPNLGFGLRDYESFTKGLLLEDGEKRIAHFEKIREEMSGRSEVLLFELARTYLLNSNNEAARKVLDEMDPAGQFRGEKFFLSGILHYISGNIEPSMEEFTRVLDCGECRHEAYNNIALIHAQTNGYAEAMGSIKKAVRYGMMAESFFNAVNIASLLKERETAWNFLMEGLLLYPSDTDLTDLFFGVLKQSPHHTEIRPAFIKFFPGFSPQEDRKMFFKLANPFVFSEEKYDLEFTNGNGSNGPIREKEEEGIDELEKKLLRNPFLPEFHSRLADMLLEEKKSEAALSHAHAALYLLRNPANFLKVLTILKKQGEEEKLKEMLIEALKYFPGNEELKNFSLR